MKCPICGKDVELKNKQVAVDEQGNPVFNQYAICRDCKKQWNLDKKRPKKTVEKKEEEKPIVKKEVVEETTPVKKAVPVKQPSTKKMVAKDQTPVKKTAPVKKAVSEKQNPVKRPVDETQVPTKKTVNETQAPTKKTVDETQTPVKKAAPVKQTPVKKTVKPADKKAPVKKTTAEAPVKKAGTKPSQKNAMPKNNAGDQAPMKRTAKPAEKKAPKKAPAKSAPQKTTVIDSKITKKVSSKGLSMDTERELGNIPSEKVRAKKEHAVKQGYEDMLAADPKNKARKNKKSKTNQPAPKAVKNEPEVFDEFEPIVRFRVLRVLFGIISLLIAGFYGYNSYTAGLLETDTGMTFLILAGCMAVAGLLLIILNGTNNIFAFLLPMILYLASGLYAFLNRGDDTLLLYGAILSAAFSVLFIILAITSRGDEEDYENFDDDDDDDDWDDDDDDWDDNDEF